MSVKVTRLDEMKKHSKERDVLGRRLGVILTRLNTGERLSIADLSREFGVSERTIQRDFNDRLSYLPIERQGSCYWIQTTFLGRLSNTDIKRMLTNMGSSQLYPDLNGLNLSHISQSTYPVIRFYPIAKTSKEVEYHFKMLLKAIHAHEIIKLHLVHCNVVSVHPYQLLHNHVDWLLVAETDNMLKGYRLQDIKHIETTSHCFIPRQEILTTLQVTNIELNNIAQSLEALILVKQPISHYFKDILLLPEQQILKEHNNGDLVLSTRLQSSLQIASHIAYWSPHLHILSPCSLKTAVEYHNALRSTAAVT